MTPTEAARLVRPQGQWPEHISPAPAHIQRWHARHPAVRAKNSLLHCPCVLREVTKKKGLKWNCLVLTHILLQMSLDLAD